MGWLLIICFVNQLSKDTDSNLVFTKFNFKVQGYSLKTDALHGPSQSIIVTTQKETLGHLEYKSLELYGPHAAYFYYGVYNASSQ